MSLSENAESLWGVDSGVPANTGADHVVPSMSEAMSGMKTRPAEKPPDVLLAALSRRPIELGRVFIVFRMRALCVMSATIKNL